MNRLLKTAVVFGNNWLVPEYIKRKGLRSEHMAKKRPPLTGETYIYLHNEPIRTCDLSYELKKKLATELTLTLLNSIFAGKFIFFSEQNSPPV